MTELTREQLVKLIKDYGDKKPDFVEGETFIPVDGSVSNGDESSNLIATILGEGRDYLRSFKVKLFDYLGGGYVNVVGSAMSAHILLTKVLTNEAFGNKALKAGDEIITTANNIGIINSAHMMGLVPVILDVDLHTLLPDPIHIETAIEEGKTKAIILSSANGNSVWGESIRDIADEFGIFYIEDVGYGFGGSAGGRPIGTYADCCIYSFHSDLLGDAGVIVTHSILIHKLIEEATKLETNSHLDLGLGSNQMVHSYLEAQMDKVEYTMSMRRLNWKRLAIGLEKHSKWVRFQKPNEFVTPSWTAFLVTLKEPHPFTKDDLMIFLDNKKVGVRSLVANLYQHEAYKAMTPAPRIDNELINSDYLHRNSFLIGCNPNMVQCHVDYVVKCFDEFFENVEEKYKYDTTG